jgi:tetratricopeptide (TPR) repeat protein
MFQMFFHKLFNPFRKERFSLAWTGLLILVLFVPALADDSQTENLQRLTKQADKLKRKGEYKEAEQLLRYVVERNPQDSKAKLDLAYVLLKQMRLLDAYDLAFPVAKDEPKNSYAFAVLGMIFLTAGNFKEANNCFINALNLNRKEHLAWAGLGLMDFYENRIERSLSYLEEAHFLEPKEPDYIFSLAQVSARAEKYKEASDYYQRFLEVATPTDVDRKERIKGLMQFLRYIGGKRKLYSIDGKRTTIPMKMSRERPLIQVYIGKHKEPLNFVLDTGSGISVLNEETARKLNIKPIARGGTARGIGGEGKFEIVYGFLPSIKIGEIEVENVPVYIRKFHHTHETIDGYIGIAMISRFLTTIDYSSLTFSLVRRDTEKYEEMKDTNSFQLRITPSGYLSGEVWLEGIDFPLNFIIDTGASISVISQDLARLEQISRFTSDERMRVIGAAGVLENVPSYVLPRLTFANQTRENIKAIVLDLSIINETSGFQQAGILGANFLKNYRLTFDFASYKVYLDPIDSAISAQLR